MCDYKTVLNIHLVNFTLSKLFDGKYISMYIYMYMTKNSFKHLLSVIELLRKSLKVMTYKNNKTKCIHKEDMLFRNKYI